MVYRTKLDITDTADEWTSLSFFTVQYLLGKATPVSIFFQPSPRYTVVSLKFQGRKRQCRGFFCNGIRYVLVIDEEEAK